MAVTVTGFLDCTQGGVIMRSTDHRTDGRRRVFGLKGLFVLSALSLLVVTAKVPPSLAATDLFVGSYFNNSVLEYDGTTGAFVRAFVPTGSGGLNGPYGLVFGSNGNLLVSSGISTGSVLEYNGTTGAFVRAFVSPGSGGLIGPFGVAFGPNGNLFVSNANTTFTESNVLEYNGTTGAFVRPFVTTNSGGLQVPVGLAFGPNGNAFVSSFFNSSVLEYNGTTGAFVRAFVPSGSGGLLAPEGLVFGPNGDLFVADNGPGFAGTSSVLEYNGTTGAFVRAFVPTGSGGLTSAQGLVFGPNGNLLVSSFFNGTGTGAATGSVLEYDGTTGAFLRVFIPPGSGGLSGATLLTFGPATAPPGTPVPEPSTWLLLGSGLACLVVWKRQKAA